MLSHLLSPSPIPTCKWKPISLLVTLFTDTTHTKYYSLCCIRILCPVSPLCAPVVCCVYLLSPLVLCFLRAFAFISSAAAAFHNTIDSSSGSSGFVRGCSLSSPIELPAKKLNKVHSVCTGIPLSSLSSRTSLSPALAAFLSPSHGLLNLNPSQSPVFPTRDEPADDPGSRTADLISCDDSCAHAAALHALSDDDNR